MKKRIITLFLLVSLLLSSLPVLAAAAEEPLPKSESGATASQANEAVGLTALEALYVGADGSKTAAGGSLVGLFTASSVDLTGSKWKNKADVTGATDAILFDTYDKLSWTLNGDGVLESVLSGTWSVNDVPHQKFGLHLNEAWASLPNFTVEMLSRPTGIAGESNSRTYAYGGTGGGGYLYEMRLDALIGHFGSNTNCTDAGAKGGFWWGTDADEEYFFTAPREKNYYEAAGEGEHFGLLSSTYTKKTAGGSVTFGVAYAGTLPYTPRNAVLTEAEYAAEKASLTAEKTKGGMFSLWNGQPVTVYTVRVYSAVLTEKEKENNLFIDLMLYYGAEASLVTSLSATERSLLASLLCDFGFGKEAAAFAARLDELLLLVKQEAKAEDVFYVKKGLVTLLSAYNGLDTGAIKGSAGFTWLGNEGAANAAQLKGAGWYRNEAGGYTIVMDEAAYRKDSIPNASGTPFYSQFGIYLPAELLPAEDYTTEVVINPVGLSCYNENGELERYVDNKTPNGLFSEYGIAIGPLRAMQFASYRPGGRDGQLERRWAYSATGGYTTTWKELYKETTWASLGLSEIVTFAITHAYTGASAYRLLHNAEEVKTLSIEAKNYITPADAGNMFQLMVGMAGTVYSVRVYNRVLSKEEMAQNHLADIIYYYGLDTTMLKPFFSGKADVGSLCLSFADMGFDMTAEEAQKELDTRLSAMWLSYAGVGIRKNSDGLRYYFDVNNESITLSSSLGFSLEVGLLATVDKAEKPLLEGYAYDYKVVLFGSDSGRNSAFFVDEDTAALTVLYKNTDKKTALTTVKVRGYVKLTTAAGEELLFYTEAGAETDAENTLFGVYDRVKEQAEFMRLSALHERITSLIDDCYTEVTLHLSAAAADGGNGTAEKPYNSFEASLAEAKRVMAAAATPTQVTILADRGEYGVYGAPTLSGADMPYPYTRFTITSRNGDAVLTTTREMDASLFEKANGLWVYQFEKDENGAYPAFRYLYVDGKMTDVAYSSGRFAADEDVYTLQFDHTAYHDFEGVYDTVKRLYEAGLLSYDTVAPYPAERTSLVSLFDEYKKKFSALMDANRLLANDQLFVDTPSPHPEDAIYSEAFASLKLSLVALDELSDRYASDHPGTRNKNFATYTPTRSSDSTYASVFTALRDRIVADKSLGSFSSYAPSVAQRVSAFDMGKIYLNAEMVGDMRDELAAGRDAAEKKAAALGETDTWMRYALEGQGLEVHQSGQWWYNVYHLTGIDYDDVVTADDGSVHVACYRDKRDGYFVHDQYSMTGRYVCLKNAKDYVDSEGEFYYDEADGKLYFYSEQDVSERHFAYPTSDRLLSFRDVKNVTLSDIGITGVDDYTLSLYGSSLNLFGTVITSHTALAGDRIMPRAAISIGDCKNFDVLGCDFYELGTKGIDAFGRVEHLTVEECTFTYLGASAIFVGRHLGNYNKNTDSNEFITIRDNYVYEVGLWYHNLAAICTSNMQNSIVTQNTVENCSYTAFSIGDLRAPLSFTAGQDSGYSYNLYQVEISYNYATNFMRELGDGGGIYVAGLNSSPEDKELFNTMHHNYVLLSNTTGNGLGHMLVGLYFDASTSNWQVYDNVVTEHSYGAVPGEDEGFDLSDPDTVKYLTAMRNRYSVTSYIYLQHITGQPVHNIRLEGNYVLNVRATGEEAGRLEVYNKYLVSSRNLIEQNTYYVKGVDPIPSGAEDIIYAAGCYGHTADPARIWNNDY